MRERETQRDTERERERGGLGWGVIDGIEGKLNKRKGKKTILVCGKREKGKRKKKNRGAHMQFLQIIKKETTVKKSMK